MVSVNGRFNDQIEIRVPCRAEYVRTIRRSLAEFAESLDMPRSAVEELEIATSEAVTNIIKHAYAGLGRMPPLRVKCFQRHYGLTVEIDDRGRGFHVPSEPLPLEACIEREGGLGITLIKTLMDSVNYESRPEWGTRIRMTKLSKTHRPVSRPLQADHRGGNGRTVSPGRKQS